MKLARRRSMYTMSTFSRSVALRKALLGGTTGGFRRGRLNFVFRCRAPG
jgi:hypothetical protein